MFIAMATCIKAVSTEIPSGQSVFFRSFCGLPVILVWIMWTGKLKTGLHANNPFGHLWRGLMGTCGMALGFSALALLPFSEVKAIQYAQPLLVVVFAAMFLGEQVRLFRLTAVSLGLAGVLIIMAPRLSDISELQSASAALGAVLALGSALVAALAHVFVRKLTQTEQTSAIVFWFAVTASTLSLLTVPTWVMPTAVQFSLLISAGILGSIGQLFLTASYRLADASVIAPFEYSSILFALLIGFLLFGELASWTMLFGVTLIVIGGVLIIWRERQLGLERAKGRKVMTPQG